MTGPQEPAASALFFTASLVPSGQQFDAWPHQPLLFSAEQGGIDWPSSCRNGTCRTCIGQMSLGHVHYEIDWPGLSAEEKAQGYVLPCVAYPRSDLVLGPASP
jgi:ferredoxin